MITKYRQRGERGKRKRVCIFENKKGKERKMECNALMTQALSMARPHCAVEYNSSEEEWCTRKVELRKYAMAHSQSRNEITPL